MDGTKHKLYAWIGLIFSLLGYFPKIGHVFSLIGCISIALMYHELAKTQLTLKGTRIYILITLLSLLAVVLAVFGWVYGQLVGGILSIVAYAVGIFVAWQTYLLALEFRRVAQITGAKSFRVIAMLLRISAFTMPLLIGFLLQALTQLVILIAVIIYRPTVTSTPA